LASKPTLLAGVWKQGLPKECRQCTFFKQFRPLSSLEGAANNEQTTIEKKSSQREDEGEEQSEQETENRTEDLKDGGKEVRR